PNTQMGRDLSSDFKRFHTLFAGLETSHGVYNGLTENREDGKILGTDRRTVRGPVTLELWEQHLTGKNGLGVVPIRSDSTVVFGAIDIDVYAELSHAQLAKTLRNAKIPLVVCRSKSGGLTFIALQVIPWPRD